MRLQHETSHWYSGRELMLILIQLLNIQLLGLIQLLFRFSWCTISAKLSKWIWTARLCKCYKVYMLTIFQSCNLRNNINTDPLIWKILFLKNVKLLYLNKVNGAKIEENFLSLMCFTQAYVLQLLSSFGINSLDHLKMTKKVVYKNLIIILLKIFKFVHCVR